MKALAERAERAAEEVRARYSAEIAEYREDVSAAVKRASETLRARVGEISGGDSFCDDLMRRTGDYLGWMQWTLWDLPYFAVAIRPDRERFRKDLAGCSLIYFACRILDDFLDRHFLYRGRRETLMAGLVADGHGGASEGLTVTIATLVYFEGLAQMEGPRRKTIDSMRRVLTGILMEHSSAETWTDASYERLIRLKNVDYWRIVYAALDPEEESPLAGFLSDYYAFAQKLNDVQDYPRDEAQSRPNYVSLSRRAERGVEAAMGAELAQLGRRAEELKEPERSIALAKWAESYQEAVRVGMFAAPVVERAAKLGFTWQTEAEEILGRLGPEAMEGVACPVCEGGRNVPLFRKQGFRYVRCGECSHVFVSPRLRGDYLKMLREEMRGTTSSIPLGDRLHADYVCRLLREQSAGPRLLDIRFQAGVFPSTARAYGFQVYGIGDPESLRPLFGERVLEADLREHEVPWGEFDVIALSHGLEFLPDPRPVLTRLCESLNENGLLYLAASDIDSLQFRIFGKEWDILNPIARPQLFCEASIERLLRECGFEAGRRVTAPPPEAQTRWMRLFRRLKGEEAGEIAVIARPVSSRDRESRDSLYIEQSPTAPRDKETGEIR